jgi:hypothetical protein
MYLDCEIVYLPFVNDIYIMLIKEASDNSRGQVGITISA